MFSFILCILAALAPTVLCMFNYTDYDNDFVNPSYILAGHFNPSTANAQKSIIEWADWLAAQGPWSVTYKTIVPPSGDKHDYMSWAPYYWPNCTGVGNTTQLTPQQIWVECPYYSRDGMFNPDRLLVNDTGAFETMTDAVFYNTIAWAITGNARYSASAVDFINTWFLADGTSQNPNLDYAQMHRGPDGQMGTHTGLLDFKQMAKLTSGILILRDGNSPDWTNDIDSQMIDWTNAYLDWVMNSDIAYQEYIYPNNHGTYMHNQVASLQILVGDRDSAIDSINHYFSHQYLDQINATGEQPLEASRTHPYHYRCYNLAAMIVNLRIGSYLGIDFSKTTTSQGATIQTAADFTMLQTPNLDDTDGPLVELYPPVAAVASIYGDPGGKYAAFLANGEKTYPYEPYFLWNQPLSNSGSHTASKPSVPPHTDPKQAHRSMKKLRRKLL